MPPRHDVESEIYGRLYGQPHEHGQAPTHVLGGEDPALLADARQRPGETAGDPLRATVAERAEQGPASSGSPASTAASRVRSAASALRARARTRLATGAFSAASARARSGVVAPAPSVTRVLAVVALAAAVIAIVALGAFVPDRATESPNASRPADQRADAGPPSAAPPRVAERRDARHHRQTAKRRQRSHATASNTGSTARASANGGSGVNPGEGQAAAVPEPSAGGQAVCAGGECVGPDARRAADATRDEGPVGEPSDVVVTESAPPGASAGDAGAGSLAGGGSSAGGLTIQSSP